MSPKPIALRAGKSHCEYGGELQLAGVFLVPFDMAITAMYGSWRSADNLLPSDEYGGAGGMDFTGFPCSKKGKLPRTLFSCCLSEQKRFAELRPHDIRHRGTALAFLRSDGSRLRLGYPSPL